MTKLERLRFRFGYGPFLSFFNGQFIERRSLS